jgi:nitrogen fixation NifU-like protein
MNADPLDDLYRETILDHARRPRNMGLLERATAEGEGKNPICGDEVSLQLALADGHIQEIRFLGKGCSISQASASMLTEAVAGRSLPEVEALIEEVEHLLRGEAAPESALDDIQALQGVARFPMRVKCALLAWKVLRQALATTSHDTSQTSS